jgi:acetylglutamate synthase
MFYFGHFCLFCPHTVNTYKKSGRTHQQPMTDHQYTLGQYSVRDVDQDRAAALVKASFGKALVPDYFTTQDISNIILEKDYRGMAVLQEHDGRLYLDKFCVDPALQSNGLGREIFRYMIEQSDGAGIFWRSKKTNPSITWYLDHALEFSIRYAHKDPWMVFWMGAHSLGECLLYAANKPETLR